MTKKFQMMAMGKYSQKKVGHSLFPPFCMVVTGSKVEIHEYVSPRSVRGKTLGEINKGRLSCGCGSPDS